MTRKDAERLLEFFPIIRAFSEGKPIQYKRLNGLSPIDWTDINTPSFSTNYEYRVRPEPPKPLEILMWVHTQTNEVLHRAYTSPTGSTEGVLVVKLFREVVENPA